MQASPQEEDLEGGQSSFDQATSRPDGMTRFGRVGWFLTGGRFSSLTRRIVVVNVVGLCLLVSGILYLNQFREGLIDARRQSLLTQAEIIAGAIAATSAARPSAPLIDPFSGVLRLPRPPEGMTWDNPINAADAAPILRRLVVPTQTNARLYDRTGQLILDSRQLSSANQIQSFALPPPAWAHGSSLLARALDWVRRALPGRQLERIDDLGATNGLAYSEVAASLRGYASAAERVNERGELIVSVAVPVQRYRAIIGSLMLSTRGGDIDRIVRDERFAILQVFMVALGVTLLLSLVLAQTIAEPVRRLADSAEIVRRGKVTRAQIPDFSARRDEIGDLSAVLHEMTNALYSRIDAIESFAADVAHELKNPLTSLRSAIETFRIAKTDEARERLMSIIQEDINRIDRLISDIADASRLDAELNRQDMEPVDLARLAETVIAMMNDVAEPGEVPIRVVQRPEEAPSSAFVAPGFDGRLGQVLRNLADNARSFTPPGEEVTVTVEAGDEVVRLIVEDRGPGIPEDNLARVFERFHTDRPDTFGEHSGLGLAISKQIVEAHRGRIWAENRDGGGARFVAEIPRPEADG